MRNQLPYSGYGNVYDCGPRGCFDGCAPTFLVGNCNTGQPSSIADLQRQINELRCELQRVRNQVPITTTNSQSILFSASGLFNTSLLAVVKISSEPGNNLTLKSDGLYVSSGGSTPTLPIITGPNNQSVLVGQNATFTITVSSSTPYTIQWYVNDTLISGATGLSYVKIDAQLSDSGEVYTAKVTNSAGTVTSDPATLTVTSASILGYLYYSADDPYPTLQGSTDPFTYQESFPVAHDQPLSVPIPDAASANVFLLVKVASTESIKTTWYSDIYNNGNIPGPAWQSYLQFGGNTYYCSRTTMTLFSSVPLVLS
jgi:Immunoglobulin I-set domain